MSRLDNALRNLGRATLLQDETLRRRAMNQILHLAEVGADALKEKPNREVFRRAEARGAAPLPVWYRHNDVSQVGRVGRHFRGQVDGKGAQLYVSGNYISVARSLHALGRCGWRPAKGPGGKPAVWLTDDEAATVRAEVAARWPRDSA